MAKTYNSVIPAKEGVAKMQILVFVCHPREGGDPFAISMDYKTWIPAFAGMTRCTKPVC